MTLVFPFDGIISTFFILFHVLMCSSISPGQSRYSLVKYSYQSRHLIAFSDRTYKHCWTAHVNVTFSFSFWFFFESGSYSLAYARLFLMYSRLILNIDGCPLASVSQVLELQDYCVLILVHCIKVSPVNKEMNSL